MMVASLAGPTGRWVVSTSSGLSGRLRHTRVASASEARSGSRAGAGGTSPAPASSGTKSASQAAVAGWTRPDRFVVRASEPRTCCQSQYGGAAPASQARPHAATHPCSEASAAARSARVVLPIPGSPPRCTTRAVPRRAAVIAVAIAVSSRARPTSTSDGSCGATPGTLPDRSATTRSPWPVGCQPGGMSTSPAGPDRRRGNHRCGLRTGLDVAHYGALDGVLHRGHGQLEPERGIRQPIVAGRAGSALSLAVLVATPGQFLEQRHLAEDGARPDLGNGLAVPLDREHTVEQQEQLLARRSLLDQRLARQELHERRVGPEDEQRQV